MPEAEIAESRALLAQIWRETVNVMHAAWLDGEIVCGRHVARRPSTGSCSTAARPAGRARGRGAYRALLRARWDEAVARGTPALITQGGSMSRPILERLGFEAVGHVHMLVDDLAEPGDRLAPMLEIEAAGMTLPRALGGRAGAPRTVAAFKRHPPARGPDHPLPLERRVELDPVGQPRPRHRPRERHQLPAPGRAGALPGRAERDRAAVPVRLLQLREQGGAALGPTTSPPSSRGRSN